MTRHPRPNPHYPDHPLMAMKFNFGPERTEWENSCMPDPPPGAQRFIRWEEGMLIAGVEPIPTPAATPRPSAKNESGNGKLETLDMAELKTIAGREGVAYDANTTKNDLVLRIRHKRDKK